MPATPDVQLTPRQRAARENGRKSQGPKTPEGKARSRTNALKHGLRAEHPAVLASEDAAAFVELGATLELQLGPADAMEQALVERIASALWRLRRADRLEALFLEQAWQAADDPEADPLAFLDSPRLQTLLRYQASLRSELYRAHAALRRSRRERRAAETHERRHERARATGPSGRPRDAFGREPPIGHADRTNEPEAAPGDRDDPFGAAARVLRRDPGLAGYSRAEVESAFAGIFKARTQAPPAAGASGTGVDAGTRPVTGYDG